MRYFRIILFAFMFSVCMVMGVAPIIPKRKEQFTIEIKTTDTEQTTELNANTILYKTHQNQLS
jgi:hypothetical protein